MATTHDGSTTATAGARATRRERMGTWRAKFIVEERYVEPRVRRNLYIGSIALIAIGLIGFGYLLVGVVTQTGFQTFDQPVETWFDAQRSSGTTGFMIVLAIVFGPVALPIVVFVVLVVWVIVARHLWRPLLLFCGMVTGVILSQVLAPIVQHPRPPLALMLFGPDTTFSFPSGHVLGTCDFLLILTFLFASRLRRAWFTILAVTLAVVGITAQVISRLYLGYHWISDTTASIALSLVIVGALILIDTRRTVRIPGERVDDPNSRVQTEGT